MMDYKPPIEIIMGQFRLEQEKRLWGDVYNAIQEYGITVDKEELIKALNYDRDQYRKGYEDGARAKADTVRKMQEETRQRCIIIGDEEYVTLCDIDQIAKDLLEDQE